MSSPRRRIIRATVPTSPDGQRQRQIQKLCERLEHERTALGRWQTRLKRAFNTVEKHQKAILRIERQRAQLEKS